MRLPRLHLTLPLIGLLHGCTMIVDADEYMTCTAGSEACKCMAGDRCNDGLECRLPGLCVLPASPAAQSGAR